MIYGEDPSVTTRAHWISTEPRTPRCSRQMIRRESWTLPYPEDSPFVDLCDSSLGSSAMVPGPRA